MDIYEATQALLTEAAPGANVTHILLQYDEQTDQFSLPAFPAVTYLYSSLQPLVNHDGGTSMNRVQLDVDVWGDLEDVSRYADLINNAINGQRVTVENVEFTVVATQDTRDIYELGMDFNHRALKYAGIVIIGEGKEDDSR